MRSKRSYFLLFLLAILVPGLGHMYAGKLKKGIYIFLFGFLIALTGTFSPLLSFFSGALLFYSTIILWYAYQLIDILRCTVYNPCPYNRWYFYILFAVTVCLTNLLTLTLFELHGYQKYRMVSTRKIVNLEQGDLVMAKKYYPFVKRLKRNETIVLSMLNPGNETHSLIDAISKVYALPADYITIKSKKVFINGHENKALSEINQANPQLESDRFVPTGYFLTVVPVNTNPNSAQKITLLPMNAVVGKVLYVLWSPKTKRIAMQLS